MGNSRIVSRLNLHISQSVTWHIELRILDFDLLFMVEVGPRHWLLRSSAHGISMTGTQFQVWQHEWTGSYETCRKIVFNELFKDLDYNRYLFHIVICPSIFNIPIQRAMPVNRNSLCSAPLKNLVMDVWSRIVNSDMDFQDLDWSHENTRRSVLLAEGGIADEIQWRRNIS